MEFMYSADRNKVILISYTKFVQCLVHGKALYMITVSCQLNAASFPLAFEWDLFLQLMSSFGLCLQLSRFPFLSEEWEAHFINGLFSLPNYIIVENLEHLCLKVFLYGYGDVFVLEPFVNCNRSDIDSTLFKNTTCTQKL